MVEENPNEQSPRKDNRWRLSSPAAEDMRWYFRCAGAALGVRASRFEMAAETKRTIALYECRSCHAMSPGRPGSRCVHCGKLLVDFERITPQPSGRVSPTATKEKPDHVLAAVAKERRIRVGLARLPRATYQLLERAYKSRQFTPEIRRVLGDFADVAMQTVRCRNAYEHYLCRWYKKKPAEKLDSELWPEVHTPPLAARTARRSGVDVTEPDTSVPLELDDWLTCECRDKGKGDGTLKLIREDAERAIGDALAEYQTLRVRPKPSEQALSKFQRWADQFTGGKMPSGRPKRRSPLERVREKIAEERAG